MTEFMAPAIPELSDQAWLNDDRLQQVMKVVTDAGADIRVAGGAVRNALMGLAISDVDLATTLLPGDVMRVGKAAGFGVHPTGFDHGTVTVVNGAKAFEVTTLRRDITTDGRHAIVQYTDDFALDAARRDFRMNSLYCSADGKIFDFTGGYADILKRNVRFVGEPRQRITEDYLRILRFFRFHALYGQGPIDAEGLQAATQLSSGLRKISAERIRMELMKLLVAPRAVATLKIMAARVVLDKIISYRDDWRVVSRLPDDGVLKLFALAKRPRKLKEKLRLSNAEALRIEALATAPEISPRLSLDQQKAVLYKMGPLAFKDAAMMAFARSPAAKTHQGWQHVLQLAEYWAVPVFPVTGKDILALGFPAGPKLGKQLDKLEKRWIASGFELEKAALLRLLEKP